MIEKRPIDKLTIKGFKSLQDVELELGKLNVLIGPNGAGKSNLVSISNAGEMAGKTSIWTGKTRRRQSRANVWRKTARSANDKIHFEEIT